MDHFQNFNGFAVPAGMTFESYTHQNPTETAIEILCGYMGKFVEIGYDTPDDLRSVEMIVPNNRKDITELLEGVTAEYIYVDFPEDSISLYTIQKMVIGSQSISQVERRKNI